MKLATQATPRRLRLAQKIARAWPLSRGRDRLATAVVGGESAWPPTADISFRFGTFLGASLRRWPRGFRELWTRGLMDEAETKMWLALLRPGDTVIDGGANWGYWTLVASTAVGSTGQVLAFEPVPSTAESLRRNVAASGASNVWVAEAALSDHEGGRLKIYTFCDDPIAGCSSAGIIGGFDVQDSIDVEARTLESVVAERDVRPTLLKLDVEGGELAALRGAKRLLSGPSSPFITFEWNPRTAKAVGYHPEETVAWLSGLGYRCFLPGDRAFLPLRIRTDISEWSPMVWALKEDAHAARLTAASIQVREW